MFGSTPCPAETLAHSGHQYQPLNAQTVNRKFFRCVSEGEMLGPVLEENTGLTELNMSWSDL